MKKSFLVAQALNKMISCSLYMRFSKFRGCWCKKKYGGGSICHLKNSGATCANMPN